MFFLLLLLFGFESEVVNNLGETEKKKNNSSKILNFKIKKLEITSFFRKRGRRGQIQ